MMREEARSWQSHVSLTIPIDRHRLEALVQNHERAGGIEADPSHLAPLHTVCDSLEPRYNRGLKITAGHCF